ncbi:hypothetical protein RKD48_005007 [Streptomyces ambofaciens]
MSRSAEPTARNPSMAPSATCSTRARSPCWSTWSMAWVLAAR